LPQASPNRRNLLRNAIPVTYITEIEVRLSNEDNTAPMPFLIFFLIISWPVLEVASIIQVNLWVGPLATFLLLAGGFAFGAFLIRSQSRIVALRVMQAVRSGAPPEKPLLESATVTLAGILFMIPGFVSDAVAVLLLVPQIRDLIWRGLSYGFRGGRPVRRQPRPEPQTARRQEKPHRADDVIDVEFTEVPRGQSSGASSAKRSDSPWGRAE
jgi:UPF0716 protein FxsA